MARYSDDFRPDPQDRDGPYRNRSDREGYSRHARPWQRDGMYFPDETGQGDFAARDVRRDAWPYGPYAAGAWSDPADYAEPFRRGYHPRDSWENRRYGHGGSGGGSGARDHDRGFFERAGDEVASWFGDEEAEHRREADHRGRGPKGYKRSDGRIEEDVNDHLTHDSRLDASGITVHVKNREVTLDGEVASREAKRRAEDCADAVLGVEHVQNNLRVKSASSGASATSDPAL